MRLGFEHYAESARAAALRPPLLLGLTTLLAAGFATGIAAALTQSSALGALALLAAAVAAATAVAALALSMRPSEANRRMQRELTLLKEAIAVTPTPFALYDPDDVLVAWNESYERLHRRAFQLLGPEICYADVVRLNAPDGLEGDDLEAYVADRVRLQRSGDGRPVDRAYPGGYWIRVTKKITASGAVAGFATDITELRDREAALAASEARFRALADTAPVGIWLVDGDERTAFANSEMLALLGLSAAPPESLPSPGSVLSSKGCGQTGDWARESAEEGHAVEVVLHTADGRERDVLVRVSGQLQDADGGRSRLLSVVDVTKLKQAERRVRQLAEQDLLTGLPNRLVFQTRLDEALAAAEAAGDGVAVLCLDLDGFKDVNDANGHAAGDALLRAVADRLRGQVRPDDTVARLGGDEFALIMPAIDGTEPARHAAERIVAALSEPFAETGFDAAIGVSVGIATFPNDALEPQELLRCADLALYRAKAEGRRRTVVFTPEMDAERKTRRQTEIALRAALRRPGGLELHYQPQFDLPERQLTGMEALVRWRHPSRGLLQPSEFVPMAEETGLIVELGAWILRRACADAAAWPSWLRVAVNVSPAQFRHREFVGLVEATLAETGLAGERLELEVKEHVLLQQTESVLDTMQRLRRLGVRIAMDDFGTGFASLGFLRRFPFDTIKIDGTFTRDLGGAGEAAAIVEVALSLCRSLHMTAIAEGVETDDQLQRLAALGCERVQGFHCGGPIPAKAVTERLAGSPEPVPIDAWSEGAPGRRKVPRPLVPAPSV